MLTPPNSVRERVLLYGQADAGKTKSYWDIGKRLRQTKAPGRLFVLDLDNAWERMATGYAGWGDNMLVSTPADYSSIHNDLRLILTKSNADDWLVIDDCAEAWTETKEMVYEKAHGREITDWLVDAAGGKIKSDYGRTQDAHNKAWRDLGKTIVRFPGHVLCCTPAAPVFKDRDDGVNPAHQKYASVGMRPAGHNLFDHLFHTVLYLTEINGKYRISTIKDRERAKLVNKPNDPDFVASYLCGVAGWSL